LLPAPRSAGCLAADHQQGTRLANVDSGRTR
jgi:hypothetical protein